jgi:hypothetical protein
VESFIFELILEEATAMAKTTVNIARSVLSRYCTLGDRHSSFVEIINTKA